MFKMSFDFEIDNHDRHHGKIVRTKFTRHPEVTGIVTPAKRFIGFRYMNMIRIHSLPALRCPVRFDRRNKS